MGEGEGGISMTKSAAQAEMEARDSLQHASGRSAGSHGAAASAVTLTDAASAASGNGDHGSGGGAVCAPGGGEADEGVSDSPCGRDGSTTIGTNYVDAAEEWLYRGQALLDRSALKLALEAFDKAADYASRHNSSPGEECSDGVDGSCEDATRTLEDLRVQAMLGRAHVLRERHCFDACRNSYMSVVRRVLVPSTKSDWAGYCEQQTKAPRSGLRPSVSGAEAAERSRSDAVDGAMAQLFGHGLPVSAEVLPFVIAALVVQSAPCQESEAAESLYELLQLSTEETEMLTTIDEDGVHVLYTLDECASSLRDVVSATTRHLDDMQLRMLARALSGLGSLAFARGQMESAQRAYAACLVLATGTGDVAAEMSSFCNLGNVLSSTGVHDDRLALVAFMAALASAHRWNEADKLGASTPTILTTHRLSCTASLHLNIANSYVRMHQAAEGVSAHGTDLSRSPQESNLGQALHHFRLAEDLALAACARGVLRAVRCSLSNVESPADGGLRVRKVVQMLREDGREPPRECGICWGDLGIYADDASNGISTSGRAKRLHVVGGCAHIFHAECLDKWLATSTDLGAGPRCPACQLPVQTDVRLVAGTDS